MKASTARSRSSARSHPRFIMLGGFLGAGKTTTILRMALHLQRLGKKVGVITNDQAAGLVDTALAEELDLPVREIMGGCFCCRSESLVAALENLEAERKPEIFIAEPVGSCTDLIATVSVPLKKIYRKRFTIAPYAVLIDPFRALQTLSVDGDSPFSSNVNYIYRKQLEEAEIIVINKVDVMPPGRIQLLRETLALQYPEAKIFEISARDGSGLQPFFKTLVSNTGRPARIMDVDYARYGAGEAELGWYNASIQVAVPSGRKPIPPSAANEWLVRFAERIHNSFRQQNIEVAHFKAVLSPDGNASSRKDRSGLAAVNLVSSDRSPELATSLAADIKTGVLLINLRAATAPDVLERTVLATIGDAGPQLKTKLLRKEAFRPSQPNPTHRLNSV